MLELHLNHHGPRVRRHALLESVRQLVAVKRVYVQESPLIFHPIAMSTRTHSVEYNTSPRQKMADNENHLSTNHLINALNSTINNQPHLLDMTSSESIDVIPAGVASDSLLPILATTLREKSNMKKNKIKLQGGNSIKENNERSNGSNLKKNIMTSMTYMDIFISSIEYDSTFIENSISMHC
ncbi:unnamed protein product [Rotaria sp. Silwood2]|nr:unnamed protein product [Rotaria sp. Silwood2]CAF4163183.1 unnamed protein product [Rotaria sp. Silwood2]